MKTVADYYNKTATGWSDEWYKEKKQNEILGKFYNCYAQVGTKHPRILDLGCGAGYDSKILSRMGARVVGVELGKMIVDEFFGASFEGGRHEARVNLITEIEKKYNK